MEKLYKRYEKDLPSNIGEYRIGLSTNAPEFLKLA
jgi:hypothetical protein